MDNETIEYRLNQIEEKLDTVTDLLLTTNNQETRLSILEKRMNANIDRWLNPLVSAIIAGVVSFILIKVGLK